MDEKIIEAGWLELRAETVPQDAGPQQIKALRNTFFAGAFHLWGSIITMLDPGAEPTERDLLRMKLIDDELKAFIEQATMS